MGVGEQLWNSEGFDSLLLLPPANLGKNKKGKHEDSKCYLERKGLGYRVAVSWFVCSLYVLDERNTK